MFSDFVVTGARQNKQNLHTDLKVLESIERYIQPSYKDYYTIDNNNTELNRAIETNDNRNEEIEVLDDESISHINNNSNEEIEVINDEPNSDTPLLNEIDEVIKNITEIYLSKHYDQIMRELEKELSSEIVLEDKLKDERRNKDVVIGEEIETILNEDDDKSSKDTDNSEQKDEYVDVITELEDKTNGISKLD